MKEIRSKYRDRVDYVIGFSYWDILITYIYDYICTIATYGIWVCQGMRYTSQNYSFIGEMKFKSSKK
jgi:hypothetical protein